MAGPHAPQSNHTHPFHPWRSRPRLTVAVVLGGLTALALPPALAPATRALIAWDVGAASYLLLAWTMMWRATEARMKALARVEDDGAATVLGLTVASAVASLGAIVMELFGLAGTAHLPAALHLALTAITFTTSWLLVHTAFALHYAHAYWSDSALPTQPALAFAGTATPVYTDFLYFAAVIGMTSQTADVGICATRMRRLVMGQGLVAFVFNTTLLALTVNAAAGLLA